MLLESSKHALLNEKLETAPKISSGALQTPITRPAENILAWKSLFEKKYGDERLPTSQQSKSSNKVEAMASTPMASKLEIKPEPLKPIAPIQTPAKVEIEPEALKAITAGSKTKQEVDENLVASGHDRAARDSKFGMNLKEKLSQIAEDLRLLCQFAGVLIKGALAGLVLLIILIIVLVPLLSSCNPNMMRP